MMKSIGASVAVGSRLAVAGALVFAGLAAWIPGRAIGQEAADPVFKALLIDGREVVGRIVSIDAGRLAMATPDARKEVLPFDRLVKLGRESSGVVTAGEASQAVLLGDGDRLMRVAVGNVGETSLDVRSELLGRIEIPLECVLGLVLNAPGPPGGLDSWMVRVRTEARASEVVWLNNGDRLAGSFLGMDERNIRMEVDRKAMEIDRGGAVALGFDPKLLNYPRPDGPFLEATLLDGTRLGLRSIKVADGNFEATTRLGKAIRFPVSEVAAFHARSKAVVYLSERAPARAQYEEYVGPTLPYKVDRAVDGQPIRLGGQTFDRGLGTQSRTLLAYRIQPGDRRFQALVGVDERAGPMGSVVFRVFVDRQERFKSSAPMTDRDPPKALDIDLTGGKILILATEFGDRGNIRDLADWAEARIIR